MKNKPYIWTAIAILVVGGFLVYREYKNNKKMTKSDSIDIIIKNKKHGSKDVISTFDESFLITWANAILVGSDSFVYKEKKYRTQGGKTFK